MRRTARGMLPERGTPEDGDGGKLVGALGEEELRGALGYILGASPAYLQGVVHQKEDWQVSTCGQS